MSLTANERIMSQWNQPAIMWKLLNYQKYELARPRLQVIRSNSKCSRPPESTCMSCHPNSGNWFWQFGNMNGISKHCDRFGNCRNHRLGLGINAMRLAQDWTFELLLPHGMMIWVVFALGWHFWNPAGAFCCRLCDMFARNWDKPGSKLG